jgi:hypothetical protein
LFRRASRAGAFGPLLLTSLCSAAGADATFEVGGAVTPRDDALAVRLEVRNTGSVSMDGPLQVSGVLFGSPSDTRLDDAIAPGQTRSVELLFPPGVPRPGIHAVTLLVSYSTGGVSTSRAAYLLLALGAAPDPAVRLFVGAAAFELRGSVDVGLESADGAPHSVRVRTAVPRGLRAEDPSGPVAVPAEGRVTARVTLLRTGAAHDTRHGIVVVAEAEDGPEARTTVATGSVAILPDPGLLPRIRLSMLALAFLLLAASLFIELRRYDRPEP